MLKPFSFTVIVFALSLTGIEPVLATDDSTTLIKQSSTMDQLTSKQSATTATTKFARDFSDFSGSQDNAEALISGLRHSTPILLTGTTSDTTITPPTKPMGYGNTYISLSLAKAQLAQYGITQPTPEQLNIALTGGTLSTSSVAADGTLTTKTVTLDGILTQRASGLGWGQIAKMNGFKLGPVISGMKATNKTIASLPPTSNKVSVKTEEARQHVKSAAAVGHVSQHPYLGSGRGITNALGGGGVVYGKSRAQYSGGAESHHTVTSHSVHAPSLGIVSAAGTTSVSGNAGNAPGHGKAPK